MVTDSTAVDKAQTVAKLLTSLQRSEMTLLEAASNSLQKSASNSEAPFDVQAFETHVTNAATGVSDALTLLTREDGDDAPLISTTYIDVADSDDANMIFIEDDEVKNIVQSLEDVIHQAMNEVSSAWDVVVAGDDVPTSELDRNYGVYESLAQYIDYVHSQVGAILKITLTLIYLVKRPDYNRKAQ
jgi:hypothetical protein